MFEYAFDSTNIGASVAEELVQIPIVQDMAWSCLHNLAYWLAGATTFAWHQRESGDLAISPYISTLGASFTRKESTFYVDDAIHTSHVDWVNVQVSAGIPSSGTMSLPSTMSSTM
ncbi:hypothetical protein WAI453_002586 [Rhynchosporium graminicola]